MNIKQKLTAGAGLVVASTSAAFAQSVDPIADVTAQITSNMAAATGIVTTAGLALITLAFLGFALRKGRRAANGRI